MNVGPPALQRSANCSWCGMERCPHPGVAQSGGGASWWFPASLQLLQCAIFRPAELDTAEGQSVGGVEDPRPESTHIFLTEEAEVRLSLENATATRQTGRRCG